MKIVLVVIGLVSCLQRCLASGESLNFLIVGDWGWEGSFNASAVAYQMGVFGWRNNAQFVLALGDNFYDDGVANTTDRLWTTTFHDVYTASSLQIPWYPILGNHDYHGNVQAQIDRSVEAGENIWKMPAKYYTVTKTISNGAILSIINIDTAILEPDHDDTQSLLEDPNWEQNAADHLKWIDETLEEHSKFATWVIVCGHYPIYSVGVNGDNSVLLSTLYPILKFHRVHMYVAGHDHNHQYITMPDGITHVIAGNGAGRGPFGPEGYNHLGISASTKYIENFFTASGFATAKVDETTFSTTLVDAKGNIHYTGVMSNPHTARHHAYLADQENHNYYTHILNRGKGGGDVMGDEVFNFVWIMLPSLVVFAVLALYTFRDEPKVKTFLSSLSMMKNEAIYEIKLLMNSQRHISTEKIRPEIDCSTRSNVGLTLDMDRSGRRENSMRV